MSKTAKEIKEGWNLKTALSERCEFSVQGRVWRCNETAPLNTSLDQKLETLALQRRKPKDAP